jgi:hypothetical protein
MVSTGGVAVMSVDGFVDCVFDGMHLRGHSRLVLFVMHCVPGTDELRDDLAHFFASIYPQYIPSTAAFKAVMNSVGSVQLNVTLGKLARGLPIYSVSITGQELTMSDSLIGLVVTTVASAFAAIVVIVVRTLGPRSRDGTGTLHSVVHGLGCWCGYHIGFARCVWQWHVIFVLTRVYGRC